MTDYGLGTIHGTFTEKRPVRRRAAAREGVSRTESTGSREPIKTWARACTIVPEFIGKHFAVHNGRDFIKLYVTEDMVGHKLGEFAPTRTFKGHGGKSSKRPAQEVAS